MNLHRVANLLSALAALAGVALFVWLFTTTDVLARLAGLPPALLLLVPLFAVPSFLETLSWALAIPRLEGSRRPPLRHLFGVRLAGESVNNALASAYVAGEPVKGLLIVRYGASPVAGLASALTGKTTNVFGEVLFLMVGVGLAASRFGSEAPVVTMLLSVSAAGLVIVFVGLFVQRRRVVGRGARLLQLLRLGPERLWRRALPGADAIDAAVKGYYERERGAFWRSTLLAAAGWLAGAAEIWVFLLVASPAEDPLLLAIVLEAGVAVVKGLSFFVPGSIGVQEGGIAWLFASTGLGQDLGVVYAVFRRFRELVWIGVGFGFLGWHLKRGRPRAAVE